MKGNHTAPSRPREGKRPREKSAPDGKLLKLGWIFLGLMLVLAAAAVFRLAGSGDPNAAPLPTVAPGPAGSAFANNGTATLTTGEGQGGRAVKIRGVDCQYTPGPGCSGQRPRLRLGGDPLVGDGQRGAAAARRLPPGVVRGRL